MKQIYIQKEQNFFNIRIQNLVTILIFNSVTWTYMVVLHTNISKLTMQNIPTVKHWPMIGVSSAASSKSTYLMMAERPKHVVDNYV